MPRVEKEAARTATFRQGFLVLPTAGMRLAPQVLVMELMREVAFASAGGATSAVFTSAMALDPDAEGSPLVALPDTARAALRALRGRAKQRTGQGTFYAPPYPSLAAHGWLRRQSDRVVRDFFLKGALAAGVAGDAPFAANVARATGRALYGDQSDGGTEDILKICAGNGDGVPGISTLADAEAATMAYLTTDNDWGLCPGDAISRRIALDWYSLCRLEPHLPRLAWIELVGTFLRTVVPLWLLAQLRVCVIVRDFVRQVAQGGSSDVSEVRQAIDKRHELLLIPSTTLTDSVDEAVIEYMRARIELNVMLAKFATRDGEFALPLSIETKPGCLSLSRLAKLVHAMDGREVLMREVLREAEAYPAWARPLGEGQGKNIEEFLRVMRNDHVGGQDDGYLLARGPANRRLFQVFPAAKVLTLFTLLADAAKALQSGARQRLLLFDLEHAFQALGIDFTILGGVRAELLRALGNASILAGTPDAGEGAVLANPYDAALRALVTEEMP